MHFKYIFKLRTLQWVVGLFILSVSYLNCSGGFEMPVETPHSSLNAAGGPCSVNNESLREPGTIDEAVRLINSLPKPLTVDCFLASLKKPLKVYAVDNIFSAQPSAGPQSPRIFIISKDLVISVVPDGEGKDLVEFGEIVAPSTSVKGELKFPVEYQLPPDAAYTKILEKPGATACRFCHQNETRYFSITTGEAYASNIFFPDPFDRISQSALKSMSLQCGENSQDFRCRMLKTIFINGQAQDVEFPMGPQHH